MRIDGWMLMALAWGIILSITLFCFKRIIAKKEFT